MFFKVALVVDCSLKQYAGAAVTKSFNDTLHLYALLYACLSRARTREIYISHLEYHSTLRSEGGNKENRGTAEKGAGGYENDVSI